MTRTALLIGLALVAAGIGSAQAQSGFYLPVSTSTSGQDEFRASDGTSCRTSMDGMKRIEVGTFGSGGRSDLTSNYGLPSYVNGPAQGNAGVYGRFTMSLDAPSTRMNCNRLYELELERRQLEIELMKRSLKSADQRLDDLTGDRRATKRTRTARNGPPP